MFRSIAIVVLLLCVALPAQADGIFRCTKKGEVDMYSSENRACKHARAGWRCRLKFTMGTNRSSKPNCSSGRSTTSSTTRRRVRTDSSSTKKPYRAPAGDASVFEPIIQKASKQYRVPADMIRAVIRVESDFHPHAVSSAGAEGLMQLMPETAKSLGVTDSFDPTQNIMNGAKYLRKLANQFEGDARLMLAGYHAGPGAVKRFDGIPYKATERYVKKVLTHYYRYRSSER
jgi:hypothetical protein